MNRDDIIRMARETGLMVETSDGWDVWQPDNLEQFAALVAAAEREACADIAENWRCNGMPRTVLADQIRERGCAMITLTREEAQQAHDALLNFEGDISDAMFAALTTLRARLAQPEPTGKYSDIVSDGGLDPRNKFDTAPPQREWQGLTDQEIGMLTVFDGLHHVEVPLLAEFIRAIEAKLKEKNA